MYLDRFEKLYIRIYDALNKDKGFNFQSGGSSNYYTPELPLEQKFAMSSAKTNIMTTHLHLIIACFMNKLFINFAN